MIALALAFPFTAQADEVRSKLARELAVCAGVYSASSRFLRENGKEGDWKTYTSINNFDINVRDSRIASAFSIVVLEQKPTFRAALNWVDNIIGYNATLYYEALSKNKTNLDKLVYKKLDFCSKNVDGYQRDIIRSRNASIRLKDIGALER